MEINFIYESQNFHNRDPFQVAAAKSRKLREDQTRGKGFQFIIDGKVKGRTNFFLFSFLFLSIQAQIFNYDDKRRSFGEAFATLNSI